MTYHSQRHVYQKKVLLVDDNNFNLMVGQKLLENQGYAVDVAYNGKEAIEKIAGIQRGTFEEVPDEINPKSSEMRLVFDINKEPKLYDIIFMDCQMPIMDGFEATKRMKQMMAEGSIPRMPIVALSANNQDQDIKRCLKVGMDGHLAKPLKEEDLQRVLHKYCGVVYEL